MQARSLGRSGLLVSPLALGGNVFGWTVDEATSFDVLDAYTAAGGTFVDTADVYSTWVPGNVGGESETIIGKWMKRRGNRERVIIATKVGSSMGAAKQGLSRTYIRAAIDQSLRRLQSEYIDLYQAHIDDVATTLEETLGAFAELIREGKVRAIGASNYTADRLADALAISRTHEFPRYESLQPLYNLSDRSGYEMHLEPLCQREGLAVIPYSALASGFLTGKYRSAQDLSKSARGAGIGKKYLNDRGLRILSMLDAVSHDYNVAPATIALSWLLARPSVTAAIASATSPHQVEQLVAATDIQLDRAAIDRLDAAGAV